MEVLFTEIDRDRSDTDRAGEVHRVPMPVRSRESVASSSTVESFG